MQASASTSLGIDFGTSNCTAFLATAAGPQVHAVPLEGDSPVMPTVLFTARREADAHDEDAYWDQTYLSLLQSGGTVLFGTPALEAYRADPLGGVLVRSPKSFLGSDLPAGYNEAFRASVAQVLRHIRNRAEAFGGRAVSHAVIGRPVHYHGMSGSAGDAQALEVMAGAAREAGFEGAVFVPEPVAACMRYEATVSEDQVVLVVDVGGGTTDCAVVRVGPSRRGRTRRGEDILGASGGRVGGTDFDQSLVWATLMPLLGKGGFTRRNEPIPHKVLADAISTRDLPAQLRFRAAGDAIAALVREAQEPLKLRRLARLHHDQQQHQLIRLGEGCKIALSSHAQGEVGLDFLEAGLSATVAAQDLSTSCHVWLDKIAALVQEARRAAGVAPDVVFVTGGMGMAPVVQERLRSVLGDGIPVQKLDMLTSVGAGLGLIASQPDGGASWGG